MGAIDTAEADVVIGQKLARCITVFGPGTNHFALVVTVRVLAAVVGNRPVGQIFEQQFDVVVELFGILEHIRRNEAFLVALTAHVALLQRITATE